MAIKYLIEDASGDFYSIDNSALIALSISNPLTAVDFTNNGFNDLTEIALANTLVNPKVHKWNDSGGSLPFELQVNAIPTTPRYIYDTIDMSDEIIGQIDSFYQESTGTPVIAFSANNVDWFSYIGGEWIDSATEMELALVTNLTQAMINTLTGGTDIFYIRIGLYEGDSVELFKIIYTNA